MAGLEEARNGAVSLVIKLLSAVKPHFAKFGEKSRIWRVKFYKRLGPNMLDFVNLFLLTSLFAVTASFCRSTFDLSDGIAPAGRKGLRLTASGGASASNSLIILRVLQGATSYYATLLFTLLLEALQWTLTGGYSGTRLLTALVLAPSTGTLGLMNYLWNKSSNKQGDEIIVARFASKLINFFKFTRNRTTNHLEKGTAVIRLLFVFAIMLIAGLSLFVNVKIIPIYKAKSDFNVTAGIGAFNASLVAPILEYNSGGLSYGILSQAYALINNPQYSVRANPTNCTGSNGALCDSYLFPGGVQTVLPSPTGSDSDPFIVVYDSSAAQLGFKRYINSTATLTGKDCSAYGNGRSPVGVTLCVAEDKHTQGALQVDLYICSQGVRNETCLNKGPPLNVSIAVSAFRRRATTVSAITNNSIVAVSQLTTPEMITFSQEDILGLRGALGWLLNYKAAGIPPVSSLAFQLWNNSPGPTEHDWALGVTDTLKNTLAFVLWFFTENNYGNLAFGNATTAPNPSVYLPSEYQTTASFANSYVGFIVDKHWLISYVVLQSLPIVASWAVVLWFIFTGVERENVSSFPLIDFKYRVKVKEDDTVTSEDLEENRKVIAVLDGSRVSINRYLGAKIQI